MTRQPVAISYFSDILCVWAYIAQIRLDEVTDKFGAEVRVDHKFVSVFGNSAEKIGRGWADRGGYEGFNRHLTHLAQQFSHIKLHPNVWLSIRPASSESAHLFVKAVQLAEAQGSVDYGLSAQFAWRLRRAFFEDCRDVAAARVHKEVAEDLRLPLGSVESRIDSGEAFAALVADHQSCAWLKIDGSPTFVLNEGRQKLYGNVGYRVIEANIREMLRTPAAGEMSWC